MRDVLGWFVPVVVMRRCYMVFKINSMKTNFIFNVYRNQLIKGYSFTYCFHSDLFHETLNCPFVVSVFVKHIYVILNTTRIFKLMITNCKVISAYMLQLQSRHPPPPEGKGGGASQRFLAMHCKPLSPPCGSG